MSEKKPGAFRMEIGLVGEGIEDGGERKIATSIKKV